MICAVVTARGGSKAIPRKNVRPFRGKPLVVHTIEAALAASSLNRVIVSTDDPEIAAACRAAGAEVPFMRPADLSGDEVGTLPVLQHAVRWLEVQQGQPVEAIVLLQPTSPLRRAEHIDASVRLFLESEADSVVTVSPVEYSPYWMQRMEGDRLKPFLVEGMAIGSRQDLPPLFQLNGAVYVVRRDVLMTEGRILGHDTRAIVMSREESVDINEEVDFDLAELIADRRAQE